MKKEVKVCAFSVMKDILQAINVKRNNSTR